MERRGSAFPPDLDYDVSVDATLPVSEGIKEIVITLLEALALVVIVVFVFLQTWRATLIPLLTVPVSLLGTFIVFPLVGFSINTLSLFGLVLAIGLVVDDAIVVVEAVQHHIEEGMAPARGHPASDAGSVGTGGGHRAGPRVGLHSGGLRPGASRDGCSSSSR